MNYDPIQLSALQPYHPTCEELEAQKAHAKDMFQSLLAEPVAINGPERVSALGIQLIEMISD
jgi:hypothetical protein